MNPKVAAFTLLFAPILAHAGGGAFPWETAKKEIVKFVAGNGISIIGYQLDSPSRGTVVAHVPGVATFHILVEVLETERGKVWYLFMPDKGPAPIPLE